MKAYLLEISVKCRESLDDGQIKRPDIFWFVLMAYSRPARMGKNPQAKSQLVLVIAIGLLLGLILVPGGGTGKMDLIELVIWLLRLFL